MAVSPEQQASILRYYHAERWRVGTIARQLGLHRDTVHRVLKQAGIPMSNALSRPTMIDPFLPFILSTLEQYPTLNSKRLFEMVRERGYAGHPDHFRHMIARHRPRRSAEAFMRVRTLPGEQCQMDWGSFGHIEFDGATRPLMAFVAVLSWSRQIFLRFYLGAHMENFLRGHVAAFTEWAGCSRVILYDNLKSAVLERQGQIIRFNPTLLQLASHYHFEPRPVAVARGNEKGRVERAIRYVRDNFYAGRAYTDLADLNRQAFEWTHGPAQQRRCPEDKRMTVGEAFLQERTHLLALPPDALPTDEIRAVSVGKTPYVRFDLNDYSVPHDCVRQTLTVVADLQTVRILNAQQTVVAQHPRCYGKGRQIEQQAHLEALTQHKRAGSAHRAADHLLAVSPECRTFLTHCTEQGEPLDRTVKALHELRDAYGHEEFTLAVADAVARNVPHPNAVRTVLDRRRRERSQPPPINTTLPEHIRSRDVLVRPHSLAGYDTLMGGPDEQQ